MGNMHSYALKQTWGYWQMSVYACIHSISGPFEAESFYHCLIWKHKLIRLLARGHRDCFFPDLWTPVLAHS